jgi:hypothetical protein
MDGDVKSAGPLNIFKSTTLNSEVAKGTTVNKFNHTLRWLPQIDARNALIRVMWSFRVLVAFTSLLVITRRLVEFLA